MQGLLQGSRTALGQSHPPQAGERHQDPDPGLCSVLGVGRGAWGALPNPERGLLASFPGSPPGFAPCLSLPFCGKVASARVSALGCPAALEPRIPASLCQGDSLSPEPRAPASGSSIQPERIKEGSEKINKHTGKTQTNPAAANEANSLYANRCLALTRPLRGEDATCRHQLRSAWRALPVPGSPRGFNVSR